MRKATEEDAARLEELEMILFPESCLGELLLKSEIHHGEGWVIECAGEVIAYCLLRFEQGLVDLTRLGVLPEHQGKGLGRRLLEHALSHARQMMLTVRKDNEAALRLYLSHGFEIVGATSGGSWMLRTTAGAT